jgi:hypothetical protein
MHGALTPGAAIFLRIKGSGGSAMPDIAYIALALASFALFALAVRGCERL